MLRGERVTNDILTQLTKLNLKCERLGATLEDLQLQVEGVGKLITGNGEPSKSIVIRLDRVEQDVARRRVWVHAAIGASVTACAGVLTMILKSVFRGNH